MNNGLTSHAPSKVSQFAVPIALGVVIELSCDLLRQVVRQVSTSVYGEVHEGIFSSVISLDFWIGIAMALALAAAAVWLMESWRFAHPRAAVRTIVFVVAVILSALLDPWGRVFRGELLGAFDAAKIGESMAVVLKRFQHESPALVIPQREDGDTLDCRGRCWIRLMYEVPERFGERYLTVDFDESERLLGSATTAVRAHNSAPAREDCQLPC